MATALVAVTLVGCGDVATPPPVAPPTSQATATPPGAEDGTAPTSQPQFEATNTPVAVTPELDVSPRSGGPLTVVTLSGTNFPPKGMLVVRVGLPKPVGESIGSAQVDMGGRWLAMATIPGTLPSGEKITTIDMQLVVMDENNQTLASVPFQFTP